ncbi:hypothetical protein CSHISOI_11424, partial [Colletotrichum shisoi]
MKVPFFKYILIVVGVIIYATAALAIPELDVDTQDLQERSDSTKGADIENPIGIDHKLKPRAKIGGATQPFRVPVAQIKQNGGRPPIDISGLGPAVPAGDNRAFRLAGLGGGADFGAAARAGGNNGRGNGRGNGRRKRRPGAAA